MQKKKMLAGCMTKKKKRRGKRTSHFLPYRGLYDEIHHHEIRLFASRGLRGNEWDTNNLPKLTLRSADFSDFYDD